MLSIVGVQDLILSVDIGVSGRIQDLVIRNLVIRKVVSTLVFHIQQGGDWPPHTWANSETLQLVGPTVEVPRN